MKKFLIILIFIFLLLSSFTLGFLVRKFVYENKFNNSGIEKTDSEIKINQLEKINLKLSRYANYNNTDYEIDLEKLTDDIYFDKNSLTKDKDSIKGWFKIYNSDSAYTPNKDSVPIYYELNQYRAYCKSNVLCRTHIKEFDKDGNLLTDELNNYDICPSYNGFINGEIYFKALCGHSQ